MNHEKPPKSTLGAPLGETPAYPPLAPQFWGTLILIPPRIGGLGGLKFYSCRRSNVFGNSNLAPEALFTPLSPLLGSGECQFPALIPLDKGS